MSLDLARLGLSTASLAKHTLAEAARVGRESS
jgi:hypothetical protein